MVAYGSMPCKATHEICKIFGQILVILVTLLSSLSSPIGDLAEETGTRVCTAVGVAVCMIPPFSIPLEPLKPVGEWLKGLVKWPLSLPWSLSSGWPRQLRWESHCLSLPTRCQDISQIPSRECEEEINSEIRPGLSPGLTMIYLS